MKKLFGFLCFIYVCQSNAQSIFERFPDRPERTTVLLLGYNGNLNVGGFGSASIFLTRFSTNTGVFTLVTAKHNLADKKTGKMFDGLLVKMNMPHGANPRYVKIPLQNDFPQNYWTSPIGLDVAVVPLPNKAVEGADFASFSEDQIVTPDNIAELDITPGLIVEMTCVQPEYEDQIDFLMPETLPTTRYGHLSRLGFYKVGDKSFVRQHVVDIHSSPGNSGATVEVLVPHKDMTVSVPMFLGIVQGFNEEADSYVPYQATVTNSFHETSITLVNQQNGNTNQIALALKTVANPSLSFVMPVNELVSIKNSTNFMYAAGMMLQNQNAYEIFNTLPVKK